MGLDVAFSTKLALQAGLKITIGYNDWSELREDGYDDAKDSLCYEMAVPNADHFVDADVMLENIVVRANKWGNTYAPLTTWLKDNNIPWSEF